MREPPDSPSDRPPRRAPPDPDHHTLLAGILAKLAVGVAVWVLLVRALIPGGP